MLTTLLYLFFSTITTLFIQKQKIFDYIFIGGFLKTMRGCQICLGYWVALVYYFVFRIGVFGGFYTDNLLAQWLDPLASSLIITLLGYYMVEGFKIVHLVTIIK